MAHPQSPGFPLEGDDILTLQVDVSSTNWNTVLLIIQKLKASLAKSSIFFRTEAGVDSMSRFVLIGEAYLTLKSEPALP